MISGLGEYIWDKERVGVEGKVDKELREELEVV